MKVYIIVGIIILLPLSIIFFGCVTTDIAYGYVLRNPKNNENLRDYIVEFDRGEDSGCDQMIILVNPVTAIKAGEKYIKLVDETYDKWIFKEPYSISISLSPYKNCIINELWLKIGNNKINLLDKVTSISYTLGRRVFNQRAYKYTQEELEQFYIDGVLNNKKPERYLNGYSIDINNIDISYNEVRIFSIEINMKVEEYNDERYDYIIRGQYDYIINVPFKRKKIVAREPYFIYWIFAKLLNIN
jgi:hypothetical protein